ncbi:MAG: hypothetical protein KatS3mg105_4599 [Gemmatales bacterium]|nr:MAG: hypothetical protein KatS3mg105_4599 [Gemmatales bacterium]
MKTYDLNRYEEVLDFVSASLWLQRLVSPQEADTMRILTWHLEIVAAGQALPPPGFVADLGHMTFLTNLSVRANNDVQLPGIDASLLRAYDDYVLGKIDADWTFERGSDAVRQYQGRDQARALAYLLEQFQRKADFDGVMLNPAAIKRLFDLPPEELIAHGWRTLTARGPATPLIELYQSLIAACRRCAELLANEDLFELERGTALSQMGQRVALRQILQLASRFENALPAHPLRPVRSFGQVATQMLDEDTYPVGGFSSISTKGTIESLLHSQLAYMEKDERPDLFDIKFLRDELLYYSRDENQFFRRRRSFVFVLDSSLESARFKDADLPFQRIIFLLAFLLTVVRTLIEWLSDDALLFEFVFTGGQLADERELISLLLRDQIANQTVRVIETSQAELPQHVALLSRRSWCHAVMVSAGPCDFDLEDVIETKLVVDGPKPSAIVAGEPVAVDKANNAFEHWLVLLTELLRQWL